MAQLLFQYPMQRSSSAAVSFYRSENGKVRILLEAAISFFDHLI